MARCELTLVANAGLLIRLGPSVILADALHDRQVESWSTVTEDRWRTLQTLLPAAGPDLILFTHCHPDHFSPRLTARAMERWPGAKLVLPEQRLAGQRLVDAQRETVSLPGSTVHLARLPHEGAAFAKVRHYGCVLEHGDFRLLRTARCAPRPWRPSPATAGPSTPPSRPFPGSPSAGDGSSFRNASGRGGSSSAICPSPERICTATGRRRKRPRPCGRPPRSRS